MSPLPLRIRLRLLHKIRLRQIKLPQIRLPQIKDRHHLRT
jgi:hypothetical protein